MADCRTSYRQLSGRLPSIPAGSTSATSIAFEIKDSTQKKLSGTCVALRGKTASAWIELLWQRSNQFTAVSPSSRKGVEKMQSRLRGSLTSKLLLPGLLALLLPLGVPAQRTNENGQSGNAARFQLSAKYSFVKIETSNRCRGWAPRNAN